MAGDLLGGPCDLRQVLGAADRAGDRDPRFVCSIGNVPLAAVLWNGGISFGGVLAFIFADLLVLPILDIYRKYYGWRMAGFLLVTFYATMAGAALIVEFLFQGLGLVPTERDAKVVEASIHLELHDRPEHPLPRPRRGARLALFQARRGYRDAANDGDADGHGARTRRASGATSVTATAQTRHSATLRRCEWTGHERRRRTTGSRRS